MTFSLVMNCYVFIEIFEFFKRSVETLCNLHNSLDGFIWLLYTVINVYLPYTVINMQRSIHDVEETFLYSYHTQY